MFILTFIFFIFKHVDLLEHGLKFRLKINSFQKDVNAFFLISIVTKHTYFINTLEKCSYKNNKNYFINGIL